MCKYVSRSQKEITFSVFTPVPSALAWIRESLIRTGYESLVVCDMDRYGVDLIRCEGGR